MKKLYNKNVKCDVCKNIIVIDNYGNGICQNCGWRQSEESFRHPNVAGIRNIPSLNNAIEQYRKGNSALLANFDDFVNAYKNYGEVEFTLNQIRYGVMFDDNKKKIALLNIHIGETQFYNNIDDFIHNAKLNGFLLSDIWENVTNTDFLQNT